MVATFQYEQNGHTGQTFQLEFYGTYYVFLKTGPGEKQAGLKYINVWFAVELAVL